MKMEPSEYQTPIVLSKSLRKHREAYQKRVINAQKNIRLFSQKYSWEGLTIESFFDSVEIYDNKNDFDSRLKELTDLPQSTKLPVTFSAGLIKRILIAVSPDLYKKNSPHPTEHKQYEKLLTHEIAHQLHIRILSGNEDAMGPMWFFEGFAIFASNQFSNIKKQLTEEGIWRIIEARGRGSYTDYKEVFEFFLQRSDLVTLIHQAGKTDFIQWLKENAQ